MIRAEMVRLELILAPVGRLAPDQTGLSRLAAAPVAGPVSTDIRPISARKFASYVVVYCA